MADEHVPVIALGVADQLNGQATAPIDRGDETQDRFRYQWAMGVVFLAMGIAQRQPFVALWCEHHEDFLLELPSGSFTAVQVKTNSSENDKWTNSDEAFVHSLRRFCGLESAHGERITEYRFCSNAPVYVPAASVRSQRKIAASPIGLRDACRSASSHTVLPEHYRTVLNTIASATGTTSAAMFSIFRKLEFMKGPSLTGYLDTLVARVIPALPQCAQLPNGQLQKIRDELMRLVEVASGIPPGDIDGVISYIASNGRPEVSIRGKCITIESAKASIEQARQTTFRYIGSSGGLPLGTSSGQKNVLHRKMRNAFLEGQFEPMWLRVISAERRLIERALADPEGFEAVAQQLEGTVLAECKDIEAQAALEVNEKKRGLTIYRDVLQRLSDIASNESHKVESEPKETLIGVAGMLSGSCRFAWGVPLEGDDDGS